VSPVPAADLKSGDVLLYHSTVFLSRLIELFDGGSYSHASIYDGDHVEAFDSGVRSRKLAESLDGATYVDVYRLSRWTLAETSAHKLRRQTLSWGSLGNRVGEGVDRYARIDEDRTEKGPRADCRIGR